MARARKHLRVDRAFVSSCSFNDGMGGGNNVHHNLIGNFVRESADRKIKTISISKAARWTLGCSLLKMCDSLVDGNENSWDRVPFITTIADGRTKSLVPAWNRNHHK